MSSIPSCSSSYSHEPVYPVANLVTAPTEIIHKIALHLDEEDLNALANTCFRMRAILSERVKPIERRAYEACGSLARCEFRENTPARMLNRFAYVIVDYNGEPQKLDLTSFRQVLDRSQEGCLLRFNERGAPMLLEYNELLATDPTLSKLGGRGSFYRGDYHRELYACISDIFQKHQEIYDEFLNTPLDPRRPMEDLRGRVVRFRELANEQLFLKNAWESSLRFHSHFCSQQSILEKAAHRSKSWLMNSVGYNTELPPEKVGDYEAIDFDDFLNRNRFVFSNHAIHYGGNRVNVDIQGRIQGNYNHIMDCRIIKTVFSVILEGAQLGSIEIKKTWCRGSFVYDESYYDVKRSPQNRFSINVGQLRVPDDIKQEANGDLPIHRLLVQIAVEVFLREDFPKLEFYPRTYDRFIYTAAGFDETYREELGKARANGILFPKYSYCGSMFSAQGARKSQEPVAVGSEGRTTRIIGLDDKPALVSFALNQEPMTWEEYLDQNGRLLGNSTEPVLPRFIVKDVEGSAAALPAGPSSSSGQ